MEVPPISRAMPSSENSGSSIRAYARSFKPSLIFSKKSLEPRVMHGRDNSFDLIRHFAALLVLFSHHFALSGLKEPIVPLWDTFGFVAVAIFFTISGYFMPQSHANSDGFIGFMVKRCKRIFPGLIVCSLIMVYVIGLIFTATSVYDYLLSGSQLKTVVMYSTFAGRVIPTVFSDFIYKDHINGSLWTLPVEFFCYLIIGSVLSLRHSWKTIMCLLWVACIATATVNQKWTDFAYYGVTMSYVALFGIAFTTGALLSMTRDSWMMFRLPMVAISLVMLWLMRGRPEIQILGTASIAVLTVVMGVSFKDKIFNGRFDISYGIYIYAFPIQQIVINRVTGDFWLSMVISTALTIVAGYISYQYVEFPFLKRKPKAAHATILVAPHA
jgi:peptidoglycan/LPS O-acetylase OafA/YrhL